MYNPTNNPLQGIVLLEGEQTVQGQIKARTIALKSCIEGRNNSIAEGIPDRIFTGWINSHKKALKELYFRKLCAE